MLVVYLIYLLSIILAVALGARLIASIFSQASRDALLQHPIVYFVLTTFVILVWIVPWSASLGRMTAQMDLARGHYSIEKYGLVRYPLPVYSRILKERYNIDCPTVSGCMVMQSEVDFKNAYNAVTVPALTNLFGKDVFEECRLAAVAEVQAKYNKK